jgi:putative nucleotidyltransferase with HDIG domain
VARVLFVDGDRHLLRELELALRSAAGEWAVVTAATAADASDQLGRQPFDAVVVDAAVRTRDGGSFLDIVSERQPTALRVQVSDPQSSRLGLDPQAHQHMAKPLHAGAVFAHLAQTLALTEVLSDVGLKNVVARLRSVPSLPPVYMAINNEFRREDASPRKVGELVARDAGMSAKILQLVNSSYFGFRVRVADPVHAVQLLGLDIVRGLVLSAHVFQQLDLRTVTRFRLGRVWRHSMAAAGCAKAIAELQGLPADAAGAALTAALLHDIGKLVMAASLPDDYGVIVDESEASGSPTWVVERDMIGTTHAEIGAYLLGLWGLPSGIVHAVAWHHRPLDCSSLAFSAAGAVHAADVVEHRVHPADTIAAAPEPDLPYLERCHAAGQMAAWTTACARLGGQAQVHA